MLWLIISVSIGVGELHPPYADLVNLYALPSDYKMHRSNDHGVVDVQEHQLKKPYHPNYDKTQPAIESKQEIQSNTNNALNANRAIYSRSLPVINPIHTLVPLVRPPFNQGMNRINNVRNDGSSLFSFSPLKLPEMSPLDFQHWSYSLSNNPTYKNVPLQNYQILEVQPFGQVKKSEPTGSVTINLPSSNVKQNPKTPYDQEKKGSPTLQGSTQSTTTNRPMAPVLVSLPQTSSNEDPSKIIVDIGKSNVIGVRPPSVSTPVHQISPPNSTPVTTTTAKVHHSHNHPGEHQHHHHHSHHHTHEHENDHDHHPNHKNVPLEQLCPDFLTALEKQLCIELNANTNLTRQHKLAIINQMQRERISRYAVDRCQWRGRDCQTCLMDMNCAYCPADNRCYDYSFAFRYLTKPSICFGFSPNYFMTCNVSFVKIFTIILVVSFIFLFLLTGVVILAILLHIQKKNDLDARTKAFVINTEY